jgi:hypothetical protein
MSLREIIAREEDRVFAVDSECFIIFTGDSIRDRKPFIRIGNWIDLPAGIIPLVENIIVTDTMTGNPSHEQFNIDIKYLRTNRYIGSHRAVERFLDFQKVFGLDLHTASVVDAEDIPEISKMNVSDRESFIGVFYRDSNFKILHKGKDLFDLESLSDNASGDNRTHDRLASFSKQRRYNGVGLVVVENNPLFYRANSFISYLFPHTYFETFFSLGINPKNIETIIHPSENFLGLGKFLKWRHARGGKLSLFCDSSDEISLIKSLFSKVKITDAPFSGMKHQIVHGYSVQTIANSFSTSVEMDQPGSGKRLRFAFVKGAAEIKHIVKERYDAIFAVCSVYEEAAALFKSSRAPIAVIDDGSTSASKIPMLDVPLIRQGIQYEIDTITEDNIFLERMSQYLGEERIELILKKDADSIEKIFTDASSVLLEGEKAVEFFNTLSLLKFIFNATSDRKLSSILKSNLRPAFSSTSRKDVYRMGSSYRIELLINNGIIYEFARKLQDPAPADHYLLDDIHLTKKSSKPLTDSTEQSFYDRILDDRARLDRLLALFLTDPVYRKEVKELKEAIERRKKLFDTERSLHPDSSQDFVAKLRETTEEESGATEDAALGKRRKRKSSFGKRPFKFPPRVKKFLRISALILIVLLAAFAGYKGFTKYKENQRLQAQKIQQEKERKENQRIVETYSIHISEYDIYLYANETAIKNGYAPIEAKKLSQRNPNWIYPGNVFILPDGERIVIKEHDTLWDIARTRLEKRYIAFFKAYEALKKNTPNGATPDPVLIKQARELAAKESHHKLLNSLDKAPQKK